MPRSGDRVWKALTMTVLLGWSLALLGTVAPPDLESDWLRWEAPASCPDAESAKAATRRRLGREATNADVNVVATIERQGDEHQLELSITREATLRTHRLTAQDCRTLAEATGLLVAVGIDPVATVHNIPTEPSVTESPAVSPGPELPELPSAVETVDPELGSAVVPSEEPAPARVERQGVQRVTLAVLGGLELGALPTLSGGPRLRLSLGWERWRLELAGSYFAPRVARTTDGAVRVQLGAADARACWRLRRGRIEAPLCGGVEVGASHAIGLREPGPRAATGLWLAPSGSGGAHAWVLPNLALVARAEVALAAVRTAYDVRDPGDPTTVFAPGLVSGRLWLGLEVNLWSRR